ncbi:MAG: hypothetical protein KatS3mg101_0128 [Patescibacteria group bacterium]|nr:MAG: hypothetical protein KatS3mg101_0128 [Patescibacteria group bacterium]
MAIVKWNKWGLPSVFGDDFWPSFPRWEEITETPSGMDIYETDDAIVVEAQVPGIKEENLEVTLEGNILTIKAEQTESEEEKKKKKAVYKSTRQTSFTYSTSLPRVVDAEGASAEIENGVVKVTIPKTEAEKPRKLEIKKK